MASRKTGINHSIGLDWIGSDNPQSSGLDWTDLKSGLDWTGLKSGLDWTGLKRKSGLDWHLDKMITSLLRYSSTSSKIHLVRVHKVSNNGNHLSGRLD